MTVLSQLEIVAKLGKLTPYRNISHFVLVNGRAFRPAPFPKGMRRGPFEFCFGNCQRLAKRRKLIFVEGYAMTATGGVGIHHAWCCDETGTVVDPTWGTGIEYFGVPLDFEYVRRNTFVENVSVLDQWERRWPIFTDPPEQWRYKGEIEVVKG